MAASSCTLLCPSANFVAFDRPNRIRSRHLALRPASAVPPGRTGPGNEKEQEESKAILSAFFLGKAFAEAFNERVASAVGEVLSQIGRRQAQQQKQIREFQEDVENRARLLLAQSQKKPDDEP